MRRLEVCPGMRRWAGTNGKPRALQESRNPGSTPPTPFLVGGAVDSPQAFVCFRGHQFLGKKNSKSLALKDFFPHGVL